jgi:hypothetical protein
VQQDLEEGSESDSESDSNSSAKGIDHAGHKGGGLPAANGSRVRAAGVQRGGIDEMYSEQPAEKSKGQPVGKRSRLSELD